MIHYTAISVNIKLIQSESALPVGHWGTVGPNWDCPRQSRAACHPRLKEIQGRNPIPVSIKNVKLVHLPVFWILSQLPILRGKRWNKLAPRTFLLLKGSFWESLGKKAKARKMKTSLSAPTPGPQSSSSNNKVEGALHKPCTFCRRIKVIRWSTPLGLYQQPPTALSSHWVYTTAWR